MAITVGSTTIKSKDYVKYLRLIDNRLNFKATTSAIIYAGPAWAKALTIQESQRKLSSVHRLGALRVIRGYRTISAVCVSRNVTDNCIFFIIQC